MTEAFAAYESGEWERAVALLQPLAAEHPEDAQVLFRLGDAFYQLDRTDQALAPLERAVRLDDGVAAYQYKLGNVLKDLGRLDDALDCYRRVLQREPGHARALNNSGTILETLGRTEEALERYRQAVDADGALLQARINLAVLLHRLERFDEASEARQGLLQVQPRSVNEWWVLGNAFQSMGRHDDALSACQRGLELDSNNPELLNDIGAAYGSKGSMDQALSCFARALEAAPQFTAARRNLATTRCSGGLVDEAIAGYREILAREPHNEHASRLLLMALLYAPGAAATLFEEHLDFARRFGTGTRPAPEWKVSLGPERRLRVGYVSSDLRAHPVGSNLLPVIQHHDRSAFEIYLYSASAMPPDHMTRGFREHADAWRSIAPLSDASAAQLILQDQVDILVLLAGRFDDNRPLLATYRPAPIQVSMHDPATSGLAEIDYLIADRGLVPRRAPERFTERVVCLPTLFLHAPLLDAPRFPEPPSAWNGRVTFGSFNNAAKINENVVALWSRVLHGVPGSRLKLKHFNSFLAESVRSRYVGLFRKHGIAEDRLLFSDRPLEARRQHLARYAEIDIALDPFPFTGSTTTFEALSMGIPVVTLEGDRMVARWSAAMLRKAGLSRLVARSQAEYVEIARQLASHPDDLARLRRELPQQVARSPLCAERARTRQLERLYRHMWRAWLARQAVIRRP